MNEMWVTLLNLREALRDEAQDCGRTVITQDG